MKKIEAIKFSRYGLRLSHLLFADDSMLFFKASSDVVDSVMSIFSDYELLLGQKINYFKLSLFRGHGLDPLIMTLMMTKLGIPATPVHEKYLGLPIHVGSSTVSSFKDIL